MLGSVKVKQREEFPGILAGGNRARSLFFTEFSQKTLKLVCNKPERYQVHPSVLLHCSTNYLSHWHMLQQYKKISFQGRAHWALPRNGISESCSLDMVAYRCSWLPTLLPALGSCRNLWRLITVDKRWLLNLYPHRPLIGWACRCLRVKKASVLLLSESFIFVHIRK